MFKKALFILTALSLLIFPFAFAGERVVTVGGNQATRPISDFNLTPSERAVGGDVYYVDGNRLTDLGNGKSWRFAFQKLSTALAASHADIAVDADRQWAARNVIYVKGDPGASFDEDLTKLAQKTDIVGVGSADGNKGPRLLGSHTIEAATQGNYMGCRFINFTFKASTNSHIFQIPTNQNGIEFINCTLEASADATYGIQATGAQDLVVSGCNFKRDVGNNYGFITAAIDIGNVDVADVYIENNFIDSQIGIVIDSGISTLGCRIEGNTIHATTLTIDDNSDSFYIINNTLISLETYGVNSYDFNEAIAAGNIITANDGTYNLPVFSDITAIDTVVDAILVDTDTTIPASITIIDEFHDVPGADNTNNAQINEVIGNKADAVTAGAVTADRTLVAYAKQNVTANIVIETYTGTDIPGTITALQTDVTSALALVALAAQEAEVEDALQALSLDKFIGVADGTGIAPVSVVEDSILAKIMGDDTTAVATTFDNTRDSLEALGRKTDTIALATLPTEVVADSLGAFVASGGTSLGTNLNDGESLVDVLYATNGIVSFPAAAAPDDGISIAEVLREIHDQAEKGVSGSTATMVDGNTIFTIAGGPIQIISLVSVCITTNSSVSSTLQYSLTATVGGAATFSDPSASLNAFVQGGAVVLNKTTLTTAPDLNTVPLVALNTDVGNEIILNEGIITIVIATGSTTGTWKHYLRYRPLGPGITVIGT